MNKQGFIDELKDGAVYSLADLKERFVQYRFYLKSGNRKTKYCYRIYLEQSFWDKFVSTYPKLTDSIFTSIRVTNAIEIDNLLEFINTQIQHGYSLGRYSEAEGQGYPLITITENKPLGVVPKTPDNWINAKNQKELLNELHTFAFTLNSKIVGDARDFIFEFEGYIKQFVKPIKWELEQDKQAWYIGKNPEVEIMNKGTFQDALKYAVITSKSVTVNPKD
jgi:hypothetical protein